MTPFAWDRFWMTVRPKPERDFPCACEDAFEWMAKARPDELIRLVNTGELDDAQTTFALEACGQITGADPVPTLLLGLRYASAVVKEGAVLGLAHFLDRPGVRDAVVDVRDHALSPALRRVAAEVLSEES